jgi:hypothetical protein
VAIEYYLPFRSISRKRLELGKSKKLVREAIALARVIHPDDPEISLIRKKIIPSKKIIICG